MKATTRLLTFLTVALFIPILSFARGAFDSNDFWWMISVMAAYGVYELILKIIKR